MALRKILTDKEPKLRKISRPVTKFDSRLHTLLDDMVATMHEAEGVGLAAPQVGVLKRAVVVDVGDEEIGLLELINPEIIETSGEQCGQEGCLSVADVHGYVNRPETVTLQAQNRDGEWMEYNASGFLAVAMCHEVDHLDGILFTDKMLDLTDEEIADLEAKEKAEEEALEAESQDTEAEQQ